MNAAAGANPEAATVTEVTFFSSEQAAQAGPVGLGHGEVGGEIALAGLVEGVGMRDGLRHEGVPDVNSTLGTHPAVYSGSRGKSSSI
jgi:hypothetical protein